jgi:pimeloyl-ACP methyl ester carboxylesterase
MAAGAIAAALGATAVMNHRRAAKAELENPPQGQFVLVDGLPIHYVARGEGRPVVFLHGNGAMVSDYDSSGVLLLASETYRVIALDRPGFGHTDRPRRHPWGPIAQAELIFGALQELGIEKPIVVAHSWATLVALALAVRYPRDIAGMVLMGGYYFPTPRLDVPLLSPPAIPVIGDVLRYTVSPVLGRLMARRILKRLFAPREISPGFAAAFSTEMALRPSQIRAAAAETGMMIPAAAALSHSYGAIAVPTVIMVGDGDRLVDWEAHSARLHREMPNSRLKIYENVGHMVHHAVPDEVIRAIDEVASAAPVLRAAAPDPLPDTARAEQHAITAGA